MCTIIELSSSFDNDKSMDDQENEEAKKINYQSSIKKNLPRYNLCVSTNIKSNQNYIKQIKNE